MKIMKLVFVLALVVSVIGMSQAYVYTGDAASAGDGTGAMALDGTWSHDNGSDAWDGSGIGSGRPGGASALEDVYGTDFLRMQDTGDPRDYGMGDPGSNRKIYFGHMIDFGLDGAALEVRMRIATDPPLDDQHPDGGGGIAPWPAEGLGYAIHDGGKGNIGIHEDGVGTISFSLTGDGLLMNNLNGTSASKDVDTGEAGTANIFPIYDASVWNVFTIDISAGGTGTHQVTITHNWNPATTTTFDVTAGNGNDYSGESYIGMGVGSTGLSGAFDVDYFAAVPEPATFAILGLGGLLLRRRR